MTGAPAGRRWVARHLVPFASPIAVATVVYFATLGPVLRAHGGENQDLSLAVRNSVDATRGRSFDLLFLGNSRVMRGVDPSFLHVPAHNFAFDDDSFLYYLYKARFIGRTGHTLRRAFIGVDVFQLAYWNYDRYLTYRDLFADPELDSWAFDLHYGPELASQLVEKKAALRYTYRSGLFALAKSKITGTAPAPPFAESYRLEPNGFYRVSYQTTRRLDPEAMPRAGIDPRALELLERTLDELRSKGVDVTLFVPPASARFRALYSAPDRARFTETITALAERHKAGFVSWEADPAFGDGDFPDDVHLSVDGAERFTRMLSAWMSTNGARE